MNKNFQLYKTMLLIRCFEERLLMEFASGKLVGTTHTYIGQEACAAGVFSVINPDDIIFSNHRCHGHFLAYGGDPYRLAAELMGKATGLVGGRGGSQHIQWRNFYSNGIQGGIVPVATGMAMAEKRLQTGNIVLVFIGDGTLGEGALYESLNMAALWSVPILFIVEDNRIAQTTPIEKAVAGSMEARFKAFGIPVWESDSTDAQVIQKISQEAVHSVRKACGPGCLLLHTYRFSAHSKGDDTRTTEELNRIQQYDPLKVAGEQFTRDEIDIAKEEIAAIIDDAFERAIQDPFPTLAKDLL